MISYIIITKQSQSQRGWSFSLVDERLYPVKKCSTYVLLINKCNIFLHTNICLHEMKVEWSDTL